MEIGKEEIKNTLFEWAFDEIIDHLNRKKPLPLLNEYSPMYRKECKPIISFEEYPNGTVALYAEYYSYYLQVIYDSEEWNPYKVNLTDGVHSHKQRIGEYYWHDEWFDQESVVEYIKPKMRYK